MMKTRIAKRTALLFTAVLLLSFASTHKFYVSVTNVVYSEKEDALQITSRIFIDDLEKLLEERYGIKAVMSGTSPGALIAHGSWASMQMKQK